MKKKMTQKQLDWNKEFLKSEWNYCIQLINEHVKELNEYTLEEHNGLSEQHMFMNVVRELIGKGHYFYNKENTPNHQKQIIRHSFDILHNTFYSLEQN